MPRVDITLPPDSTLLPIEHGALLVSPSFATFCYVPARDVEALGRLLAGVGQITDLGPSLLGNLEVHGFFSGPRPLQQGGMAHYSPAR